VKVPKVVKPGVRQGFLWALDVAARVIPMPMMFKMYLLNDEEVFFGFYPVVEREVEIGSKSVPIFDAVGKDTVLFHHSVSDDDRATGSQYVDQARRWSRSTWPTIHPVHSSSVRRRTGATRANSG
jgi:hypothetical protein